MTRRLIYARTPPRTFNTMETRLGFFLYVLLASKLFHASIISGQCGVGLTRVAEGRAAICLVHLFDKANRGH